MAANLNTLRADVKAMAEVHVALCKAAGIELLIYCALRTNEEQAKCYAQGRTSPGKIITNCKPGQSAHNPDVNGKSRAYDCVPVINGKPVWDNTSTEGRALWSRVGDLGEKTGLAWAGRWTGKLKETAHFEAKDK